MESLWKISGITGSFFKGVQYTSWKTNSSHLNQKNDGCKKCSFIFFGMPSFQVRTVSFRGHMMWWSVMISFRGRSTVEGRRIANMLTHIFNALFEKSYITYFMKLMSFTSANYTVYEMASMSTLRIIQKNTLNKCKASYLPAAGFQPSTEDTNHPINRKSYGGILRVQNLCDMQYFSLFLRLVL